jgi:hypothetical protein
MVLFASLPGGRSRRGSALLTPIDARLGPLAPVETGAPLSAINGQSAGEVPLLVMNDLEDTSRLVVADGRTGELRHEIRLPAAVSGYARVAHGRDGFVLIVEPLMRDASATVRLFDGETGRERYSTLLDSLHSQGRPEVTLVEGAVLLASGGRVAVLRSSVR